MNGLPPVAERFQVIVVGAGVGGCVMAGRLAGAGLRTVVLEAGPAGPLPPSLAHGGIVAGGPEIVPDWFHMSAELSTAAGGPSVPYLQGRGIGGGSAVNGMVLSAGIEADYTGWYRWLQDTPRAGQSSQPGHAVERWLERAVHQLRPETRRSGPVADAFDRVVGERWGLAPGPSSSVLGAEGLLPVSLGRRHRGRLTVADAYLDGSVVLMADTEVDHLVHDGSRVRGAVVGADERLEADHVVLCAGPIQSPALLMRSGLVPGVDPAARSPVRWRGLDHPAFAVGFDWPLSASTATSFAAVRRQARARVHSDAGIVELTLQIMGPFSDSTGPIGVILAMTDPAGAPVDVAVSADGAATISRRWLDSDEAGRPALSPWLVRELAHLARTVMAELHSGRDRSGSTSVDDVGTVAASLLSMSDDEVKAWIRATPAPVYHLAATMIESTDIVRLAFDRPGSLEHVEGLTVADSSTMPNPVGGGVQLAVMAWAEFLADDLIGRLT